MRLLDRSFFRTHHRLAAFFARNIVRGRWRWLAWLLGRIAARSESPGHTLLETSTSRLHEREENLQAAADKFGGHLFECRMQLAVHAPAERKAEAVERLRSMAGALGAFTQSRLATFQIGKICPQNGRRVRLRPFLPSHSAGEPGSTPLSPCSPSNFRILTRLENRHRRAVEEWWARRT